MFYRYKSIVTAVCALTVSSVFFDVAHAEPLESAAEAEGVWQPTNNTAQFKVQLDMTASGGLLAVSRVTQRCTYVIAPTSAGGSFDSFPIKGRKCETGQVNIARTSDGLTLDLPAMWNVAGLKLVKLSGPDESERVYPTIGIRSVRLNDTLSVATQKLRNEGMSVGQSARSERVLRNVPGLVGSYVKAATDYGGEFGGTTAVEDIVGLFQVEGDANTGVAAILRHWAPAPNTAPTAEAFTEALIGAYGAPHPSNRKSPRTDLKWYFGADGQPATGATLEACKRRPGRAIRVAAIVFDTLKFFPSTGRAKLDDTFHRQDLSPQNGCGFTLYYVVNQNDDGTLLSARASFYDHRAVANQIWAKDRKALDDRITRALEAIGASQSNASKL